MDLEGYYNIEGQLGIFRREDLNPFNPKPCTLFTNPHVQTLSHYPMRRIHTAALGNTSKLPGNNNDNDRSEGSGHTDNKRMATARTSKWAIAELLRPKSSQYRG